MRITSFFCASVAFFGISAGGRFEIMLSRAGPAREERIGTVEELARRSWSEIEGVCCP